MGCGDSKPPRRDMPCVSASGGHCFEVHAKMGFQLITDGNQCNWMDFTQCEHLRRKAEGTALDHNIWSKAGNATLIGPKGLKEDKAVKDLANNTPTAGGVINGFQERLITFEIGNATFKENKGKDEEEYAEVTDQAWEEDWRADAFAVLNWNCERKVSCENLEGNTEMSISCSIDGSTRVKHVVVTTGAAPSPRDVAPTNGKPVATTHQHDDVVVESRYEIAKYTVKIGTEEFTVEGAHHSPNDCSARYGSDWQITGKKSKKSFTVKTHYEDECHTTFVETVFGIRPMGALCAGIPMGLFMHPLEVEKYAKTFVLEEMNKPVRRRMSMIKGNNIVKKGELKDFQKVLATMPVKEAQSESEDDATEASKAKIPPASKD